MSRPISNLEIKSESLVDKVARVMNVISAVWLFSIALLILFDVVGREAFDSPFHGTNEIVSNSVLSILFLQLPLTIMNRSSLRTTIVYGQVGLRGKSYINVFSYGLGALLFLAIAIGGWPNMIEAWAILEQEGSGIINIPVYPIRTLVVFASAVGLAVCALLIYQAFAHPQEFEDN